MKRIFLHYGIVGIIALILSSIITWPLILDPIRNFTPHDDAYQNLWFLWWLKHALVDLHSNPYVSNLMFFPMGVILNFNILLIPHTIALPFTLVFGPIAGYNVLVFFSTVATAVGTYAFLAYYLKDRAVACWGAIAFTFSAYRMVHLNMGHIDMVTGTAWIGWYLLSFSKMLSETKIRNVFFTVMFLAFIGYTDYRTLVMISFFTCVFILVSIPFGLLKTKGVLKRLILYCIAAIVMLGPHAFLMHSSGHSWQSATDVAVFSADIMQFFTPLLSRFHAYFSEARPYIAEHEGVYLGYFPLMLASIGVVWGIKNLQWRRMLFPWLVIGIFFFLLAIGPAPILLGKIVFHSQFWPYNIILRIPVLSLMVYPGRWVLIIQLVLMVLGSMGLKRVIKDRSGKLRILIVLVICIFTFVEKYGYLVDVSKQPSYELLSQLTLNSQSSSILEIPYGMLDGNFANVGYMEGISLYRQTIHLVPLLTGYVSRVPYETWNHFEENSLFQKIIACQEKKVCINFTDEEKERLFNFYRLKYVIVKNDPEYEKVRDWLGKNIPMQFLFDADDISLYTLR